MTNAQNARLTYNRCRYEVLWTSQNAWHIAENYADGAHGMKHEDISRMLTDRLRRIEKDPNSVHKWFVYALYRGKIYRTVVSFNRPLRRWVVITSYRESDPQQIIEFNRHKADWNAARASDSKAPRKASL
jgi:hypothetical protein